MFSFNEFTPGFCINLNFMSNGKRIKSEKRLIIYKLDISLYVRTHGHLIITINQIHIYFKFFD